MVMTRGVSHGTRMRADWEPPGTLFVVFNDGWQEGISSLAQAARAETDVVIVVTEGEAADPSVRGWISQRGLDAVVLEHNTPWIRDYGPVELNIGCRCDDLNRRYDNRLGTSGGKRVT